MSVDPRILHWLRDSDPSLRWQVERDLAGEPAEVWQATRARVATEGYGAALLAQQGQDGQWEGGAYFPAGFFGSPEAEMPGQPWTATTWTLKDLREWGVPASALGDTADKLDRHSRWEYDDLPYWGGEVDVCINAFTLGTGAWLAADVSRLAQWFPEHQLADGGWNCEAEEGDSVRSSFHSTLNALRGMLAYEEFTGDTALHDSRRRGQEYLLERRLLYRLSTGDLVGPFVTQFVYPNRHRYSALAALDLVRAAQQPDGSWHQGRVLEGRRWFDVDAPEGQPSRWLTFLALRALQWWDAAR
ncbi:MULTISPECIES: squalene cyclase [unclassified Microbacterium]|uniref:squalene cyclase n=1 Tax=unclassified Microbacterium TaxID=2609290 RepID=UPI003C307FFE